ncbi:MAG: limonene-1,2-epoxide hydrolase family protein [Solirubrobacteraceae bacterium]
MTAPLPVEGAPSGDDPTQITLDFLARWGVSFDAMCASFHDVMAPGCPWEQRPMAITHGPDQAVRFLRLARRTLGLATIVVETPHIARVGNVVLTERIDHLLRADGTIIASATVAGVFEFDDGHLVRWREHFDAAGFAGQIVGRAVRRRRYVPDARG